MWEECGGREGGWLPDIICLPFLLPEVLPRPLCFNLWRTLSTALLHSWVQVLQVADSIPGLGMDSITQKLGVDPSHPDIITMENSTVFRCGLGGVAKSRDSMLSCGDRHGAVEGAACSAGIHGQHGSGLKPCGAIDVCIFRFSFPRRYNQE